MARGTSYYCKKAQSEEHRRLRDAEARLPGADWKDVSHGASGPKHGEW